MIYTINGEEVDYVKVNNNNESLDIVYTKKFDIVTANIKRINKRLRENQINGIVCKDLYKRYIGIYFDHIEDYTKAGRVLNVPLGACSVDKKNNFLIINIDKLPKYKNKDFLEIIEEQKKKL